MSLKDLFKEQNYKYISNATLSSLTASGVESPEYIEAFLEESARFIPLVDYSKPENFARFGSAEKYYYDSITRTYNTYPYDGSKKEKLLWELSSSGLDLYLFDNGYPRTTGYAVFTTESVTATDTSTNYAVWGSYGAAGTGTYEYVHFSGGPHAGEGTSIYIDPDSGEAQYRKDANIYDLSENRECNLKIDGNDGNTVEFWLKKAAFNAAATQTEVVFDIFTTSSISSSLDYGRMTIEMSGTATASPFFVTYMSGTDGISKQQIGNSLTPASIADDNWHHYSFRFKNDGSNTSVDLFVDGEFNHNVKAGTTIDYVSGTLVGNIGALATHPSGTTAGAPQADKGWGKLSGSLDEFRFWKVWRNSQQIQTRWFDQVGGGTNTDISNTHLGLYYKFNEGITQTASVDSVVLDYSGRVSNGSWFGYSSLYSRETGSAINESNLTTYFGVEFEDPILYSFHPEIVSFLSTKRKEGRERDYNNPSTLYYTMPGWILDEHDANDIENEGIINNSLWNLTQIVSSYFDNAANMMKSMPSLAQNDYFSGSEKPVPFMNNILESKGFFTPEIFNALDALEAFENRDNNSKYTGKVNEIKNIIYKNIYNNLTYINKSKGTEKSIRNLIRCFGINDKLYKLNLYSNNVTFNLEDNFHSVSEKYKLLNFNTVNNSDACVFQTTSSVNPNSTTFISASGDSSITTSQEYGLPFSVEANVIFPNRVTQADYSTLRRNYSSFQNDYPLIITSSIFGMHTADDAEPEHTTWPTDDYANFVVQAVKPEAFTKRAKFVLTGTAGGFIPELTSSFYEVYNDLNWNFLVSLYSSAHPNSNEVSGTADVNVEYIVEFSGIQKVLDVTVNEFTATGTISADSAAKFLSSPKRMFVGAHRTNFTGSVVNAADHKFNTLRVWQNKLTMADLSVHASDPSNYSIKNPEQNAYLFNTGINDVYVPNKETLLLHWDYTNVTASDASGEFIVEDLTSGSSTQTPRYGFLNNIANKQFTGRGFEFAESSTSVVVLDDLVTAKASIPEVLADENTIKVLQNDDIYFTRDSRPTFFDLYVEKSPYQNISEEMLKFMSTVVDFNNLIGHGVNRYRSEYKSLNMLRQLFFQRMDAPNIDKYIEYFKWFDFAIATMIQKLAPMSSGLDERPLRNIIESHILERNKYQSKFPTYEFKQSDPEASLFGINELLYPWKEGHFPIETPRFNLQSLAFPGGGGAHTVHKADIGIQPSLSFGADGTTSNEPSFSISAWVYMTDVGDFSIFSKGFTSSMQYVLGTASPGIMYFTLSDSNDSNFIGRTTSGIAASETIVQGLQNQWAHIVATYDGSRVPGGLKLYVNGSELATAADSGGGYVAMENLSVAAQIGRSHAQAPMETTGFIDELAVMSVGLSAIEVSELYNGGVTFNLEEFSRFADFVSWWRLGDSKTGAGPVNFTLPDLVGNNDVTMSGFTGNSTSGIVDFHAPSEYDQEIIQENNCLWAKERAERTIIPSRDAEVDSDRQEILDVINNLNNATPPNLSDGTNTYQGSTYALRRFARPYKLSVVKEPEIHGGGNSHENKKVGFWDSIRKRPTQSTPGEGGLIAIAPPDSNLELFEDCDDNLELNKGKRKFKFSAAVFIDGTDNPYEVYKGQMVFPFSLYSSSVDSNSAYIDLADFKENLAITNLHHDNYGPFNDVPMQGPFTEKYVGGRSYRHVMTNFTPDNEQPDEQNERLEGWRITGSSEGIDLVNVDPANPKSVYFREEYAKRPVNIKNIRQLTSSLLDSQDQATDAFAVTKIGNYTNTYEIVMTNGRSINNRYLAESEGELASVTAESTDVSGVIDFALPRRDLTGSNKSIIVNRFSAPGDPATMGEGFLDVAAAEFSVYNALPFRNLPVRVPLNELHSDHTNQFGLFSDAKTVADYARSTFNYPGGSSSIDDPDANLNYIGTGSFHKVNRNGRQQPFLSDDHLSANTKLLNFDGSNHFVLIGEPDKWNNLIGTPTFGGSQKYTLSAWIHPTALNHAGGGNFPRIFDFADQDVALFLKDNGQLMHSHRFASSRGDFNTATNTIQINRWYHVAVTYDATSPTNTPVFYVNGEVVAIAGSSPGSGANQDIQGSRCFIGDNSNNNRKFQGFMDELSVWDDVLTAAEVQEIYNDTQHSSKRYIYRGGPGVSDLRNHSAVSKLIAWWSSDDYSTGDELPNSAPPLGHPDEYLNEFIVTGTLQAAAMVIDNDGSSVEILQPVQLYIEQIGKKYDNFFVQHQIPQTDVQYAWITASLIDNYTGPALFGFEQPDFSNASLASTDLIFQSTSFVGSADCDGTGLSFGYYPGPNSFTGEGTSGGACGGGAVFTSGLVRTPFVGLNTNIREPVTSSENYLGFPAETPVFDFAVTNTQYFNRDFITNGITQNGLVELFNALTLHRQGPYGGSNWKLYKKDNHPIVRTHRKENRLSFVKPEFGTNPTTGRQTILGGNKGTITSVFEPPITSKYKQITHRVVDRTTEEEVDIDHTYMNNVEFFTDHSLDGINLNDLLLETPGRNVKKEQQMLDVINYYLYKSSDFDGVEEFNPISGLVSYTTRETIFPREQHTYLSTHRQRDEYANNFWRDTREDRTLAGIATASLAQKDIPHIPTSNAVLFYPFLGPSLSILSPDNPFFGPLLPGNTSQTASIWPLDARENFETLAPARIKSSSGEGRAAYYGLGGLTILPIISGSTGTPGILLNDIYPYQAYIATSGNEGVADSVVTEPEFPENMFVVEMPLYPQYARRIAGATQTPSSSYEFMFGDTKWEAGEQSGKTPFYDTYSDYVEDIKRVGKDYGIIPEFRISNHMEFYLNEAPNGFLSKPENFLEMTGTAIDDSSKADFAKVYTNSDFLRTFSTVDDMYSTDTRASRITLSADALIKFLPYNGFFPADRTVELARLFYTSYSSSFAVSGNIFMLGDGLGSQKFNLGDRIELSQSGIINPIWKSLFAPGILFNSIKSGMAVDYPVHTSDDVVVRTGAPGKINSFGHLVDIPRLNATASPREGQYGFRVPFEALLNPEEEFQSKLVIDSEPHPSASVTLTASISNAGAENYKLAMNNFLASTIDFFRPNGEMTTISSVADTDPLFGHALNPPNLRTTDLAGFTPGSEYRMRIVMYNGTFSKMQEFKEHAFPNSIALHRESSASFDINPQTCVMYAQTSHNQTIAGRNLKIGDYHGCAFGPPVDRGPNGLQTSNSNKDNPIRRTNFSSGTFEPYTPPYYDGYAHAELIFRPESEDDYITMGSVLEKLTVRYARSYSGFSGLPIEGVGFTSDLAIGSAMQISASINVGLVNKPTVVFDALGNPIQVSDEATNAGSILTIQPKWETPILNFKDVDVTLPTIGSGSVARGMWHQYGRKPSGDEGIFLQVQDLDPSELDDQSLTGSLRRQLGISQDPVRLGTVAQQKKISEAIVAIPFYIDGNGNERRFEIKRSFINVAKDIAEKKQSGLSLNQNVEQPDIAIVDMVSKMKKFVIPPHLDFVTNDIAPFAMFIFDFEVTLSETDLTDIWQNLSPDIGRSFKKAKASLPVDIFPIEVLPPTANGIVATRGGLLKRLPDNTRWMVFKVKQRSAYNYFAKTARTDDDKEFKFKFKLDKNSSSTTLQTPDYSYNWPFDFFSLIELAKIEAEVEVTTLKPELSDLRIDEEKIGKPSINQDLGIAEAGMAKQNQKTTSPSFKNGIPPVVAQQIKGGGGFTAPPRPGQSNSQVATITVNNPSQPSGPSPAMVQAAGGFAGSGFNAGLFAGLRRFN